MEISATICAVCYGQENGLKSYSVTPNLLCDEHFFEWAQEKAFADMDNSTEGLYL